MYNKKLDSWDWAEACYPVKVKDGPFSDLEAARHALWKWMGVRPDVLKFFNASVIRLFGTTVIPAPENVSAPFVISFDGASCCLCDIHPGCEECPLVDKRENHDGCRNEAYSKFTRSVFNGGVDPSAMIYELTLLVQELEEQAGVEPCYTA